ncbi:MAG: hypothetical protein C5B51_12700, partial [Terriglobia bacterium]
MVNTVAGEYFDGLAYRGYVRDIQGTITTFDAGVNTIVSSINDGGTTTGYFANAGGVLHSFWRDSHGTITTTARDRTGVIIEEAFMRDKGRASLDPQTVIKSAWEGGVAD